MASNLSAISVRGLVLSSEKHKEHDRIIRILTRTHGKISACAPGAGRPSSRHGASAQPGVLSDFCLTRSRDFMYLSESELVEPFRGIYEDIEKLTACSHLIEIAEDVSIDNELCEEMYPFLIHSLFVLSESDKDIRIIISAFEWKLMELMGFSADLSSCDCHSDIRSSQHAFSYTGCKIYCMRPKCLGKANNYQIISTGCLEALRYIQSANPKTFMSFQAEEDVLDEISILTRRYLCERLDKKYCKMDLMKDLPKWDQNQ